jgi:hypothetical protein
MCPQVAGVGPSGRDEARTCHGLLERGAAALKRYVTWRPALLEE